MRFVAYSPRGIAITDGTTTGCIADVTIMACARTMRKPEPGLFGINLTDSANRCCARGRQESPVVFDCNRAAST
jgi:hypothetical protein